MDQRLFFAATLRNRLPISKILGKFLPQKGSVLELASGSGEHGVYFQNLFPNLIWLTSDPHPSYRESIISWINYKRLNNIMPKPLDLDVRASNWPVPEKSCKDLIAIVAINLLHVSGWDCTEALFKGSRNILKKDGLLILYGPFIKDRKYTSESNLIFDRSLKEQNANWGLRELEKVDCVAIKNSFVKIDLIDMPANNFSVIYKRT